MSTDPQPVELVRLQVGSRAQLFGTRLGRADFDLLQALGLTEECRLRVCRAGDPWIVQVRSTRIGIADLVARDILVIPEPAE